MDVETILYRAESLFQVFRLKIREVATVRLGVDVATGVSVGDSQNTPLKKETVADGTDPNFTTDSTKMVDSNGHKLWGCAMDEFGLDMMSDEEIWELLALLEKKEL